MPGTHVSFMTVCTTTKTKGHHTNKIRASRSATKERDPKISADLKLSCIIKNVLSIPTQ